MNESIEILIVEFCLLIVLGIFASYISERINKPIKIPEIFTLIVLGILAGPVFHIFDLSTLDPATYQHLIHFLISVCLLTLLFEGGFNLHFREFLKNLRLIGILATAGVLITTAGVGFVIHYITGIELIYCLLIGAILAATDPASVIALGRSLKLPKELTTTLEGESSYNDATSIILFFVILSVIMGESFSLSASSLEFIKMLLGGIFVGAVFGLIVNEILKRNKNENYTIWLTILLAVLSFFIAEHFEVSGVIACVTAGMVISAARSDTLSPREYRAVLDFWEFARFGANSVIFLVLGTLMKIDYLTHYFALGVVVVFVLIILRFIIVEIASFGMKMKRAWKIAIVWAGLRGSVPMLLVATVVALGIKGHDAIAGIVASVVFLSIAIQGLTSAPLIEKLNIGKISKSEEKYEEMKAHYRVLKAGRESLKNKLDDELIDEVIYNSISGEIESEINLIEEKIDNAVGREKKLKEKDILQTKVAIYEDMIAKIREEFMSGALSDAAYRDLREEMDKKLLKAALELKKFG